MLLLVLAVVATVAAIALGRLPGGMPDPSSTVPPVRLPEGAVTGGDVHRLRFVPGLRGYRMDQVDPVVDRLGREIDELRSLVPPDRLQAHDQSPARPGTAEVLAPGDAELREPGVGEVPAPGETEVLEPGTGEVLEAGLTAEHHRAQAWTPMGSDEFGAAARETGR